MSFREFGSLSLIAMLFVSSCTPTAPPSPPQTTPVIPHDTQVPSDTPAVTATQSITPTPDASDTPLPSPTPEGGPITDDFSSRSDIWGDCEQCDWKDGVLYFGPFLPAGSGEDQIFYLICQACGENTYYRVAADVTYVEGYGSDRTFGILAGLTSSNFLGAATITTGQHALYETFDFDTNSWGGTPFRMFGAVKPGRAANRIEVILQTGIHSWKS